MFLNYLKTAIRSAKKQKGYSVINITGLAIGIACCILLTVYIHSELSFDRFHENLDRIYRLGVDIKGNGVDMHWYASNAVAAPVLKRDYPEVVNSVRLGFIGRTPVKHGDLQFYERSLWYADDSVFDIFTFPMISGDPETALKEPYTMVITERIADKYFGGEDPVGKVMKLNDQDDYTIKGVVRDVPQNSTTKFDFLCSFITLYAKDPQNPILNDWISYNYRTYILLQDGFDYRELEKKFPALIQSNAGERLESWGQTNEYFLQPLKDVYLYTPMDGVRGGSGAILYVYIFSMIALFVLLIACINFMNLSTARSAQRAREVGMRKVFGADRNKLRKQFLCEALIYSFSSMLIALLLVKAALPVLSSLSGRDLSLSFLEIPWLIPGLLGITLFVGLISGSYPAIFLAAFEPVKVLKGNISSGSANTRMRKILVIFQFSISIALIICTWLISNQLNFMKEKHPGFDKEHVVVLPLEDRSIIESLPAITEELKRNPGVISVAASSTIPGFGTQKNSKIPEGYTFDQMQIMDDINVDHNFIQTVGMELVDGRNFSPEFPSDGKESIIINETAARTYGWEDPVGKTIRVSGFEDSTPWPAKTVIGVVRDVHIDPLTQQIYPLIIDNVGSHRFNGFNLILIRINPTDIEGTIRFIERKWSEIDPGRPFDYFFLDEAFDRQFREMDRTREVFSYFTFVAIFIACLGLFGMASFTAEKRTKEIGIRKVLGARTSGIVMMMSREVLKYVAAANLIAFPVAYLLIERWIRVFPYRTEINLYTFVYSAALIIAIGFITVSYQAVRAGLTDPVTTLRSE